MFEEEFNAAKSQIFKYNNFNRDELFTKCITYKLAQTLQRYNEEIDLNTDYLLTRSSTKVLKALTKMQKKDDKKALEAQKELQKQLEQKEEFNLDNYE